MFGFVGNRSVFRRIFPRKKVRMKCYLLLFLVALAIAEENLSLEVQFSAFKTRFHRQYASDTEEKYRLRVFRENLQIIQ